ncbi:MAG TPA: sugar ABC transporter substrate-binding protein [Galbitalea sp.]|jgi:multiple sugar transport system substrate-binding protein|nr:sugar ABC transporter substrate-binding protein [Galbitalea sp.]
MKHSTKRIAALLIAAGLTIAGLTACSSSSSPSSDKGKTLDVAYWNYGPGAVSDNNALKKGFEKENPGVKVTLTPVAGDGWGDYVANLAIMIASGKHPDIAFMASEGVKFLDQNNLLLPINNYLKTDPEAKKLKADIAPSLLKAFSSGNDIASLPNGFNDFVIYYNTALFQKAGIPAPTGDWTWDQFQAVAKQLTTNGTYGYAWTGTEIAPGVLPWIANQGGNLVGKNACSATANSAPVEKTYDYLEGLIKAGISPTPPASNDLITDFENGKIAMFGAGRYVIPTMLGQGFKSFDITRYPTGSTYQTTLGASGYPILKSSPNPDLAWKFQKYAASAAVQDAEIGTPTAPFDSIPTLRSTANKTVAAGIPPANTKLYYDAVDNYKVLTPFPGPARYTQFAAAVLQDTQLIFGGDDTVKQGLDQMQKDLEPIVTCSN